MTEHIQDTTIFHRDVYFKDIIVNGFSNVIGSITLNGQTISQFSTGTGNIPWGSIIGTLNDQDDLKDALNNKADNNEFIAISGNTILLSAYDIENTNNIIYLSGFIYDNTSSIYNISVLSGGWNSVYTQVHDLSTSWNSVYTTFNNNSALFLTSVDLSDYTPLSTYASTSSVYTTVQTNSGNWNISATNFGSIGCNFNGAGNVILSGLQTSITIPYNCIIKNWTMISDVSGIIGIDIWNDTLINYPPTILDSIVGNDYPNITNSLYNSSANLSAWDVNIYANDVLTFYVNNCTNIKQAQIVLKVEK